MNEREKKQASLPISVFGNPLVSYKLFRLIRTDVYVLDSEINFKTSSIFSIQCQYVVLILFHEDFAFMKNY